MNRGSLAQYERFGRAYHLKRTSPAGSFYNDLLDRPALTALLRGELRGRRVLDLGCGSGLFTRRLARAGARVVGLDQSETMLALARAANPGVRFVRGDAAHAPFPPRSFDVVVSALMAHYFADLRPLFREAARVLKPGGAWAFSFHHPFNETLRFTGRRGRAAAAADPYFHRRAYEWRMGPMRLTSYHHTFEEVFESLRAASFVVERLLEPRPPARAARVSRADYERTRDYPSFCALRARLLRRGA
jgi:SAM-dependent methyltransferase